MTDRSRQSRLLANAVLVCLITVLAAGCGGKTTAPGDDTPKRALDPRSEALRYYPADTEGIALLTASEPEALMDLDAPLKATRGWREFRDRALDSLREGGIDPERIRELSARPAVDIDLPLPEIVFGVVPGAGPPSKRLLAVLATEQGVEMAEIFHDSAEAGDLVSAGEFDGARLYRGADLDFAVRDGVLIAAADINRLQQAITRRDGDRDAQLNDAPVTALLNELPEAGTMRAYLAPGNAAETLLTLIAGAMVEPGQPLPEDLPPVTEAALSARAEDGARLAIDVIIKVDRSEELEESAQRGTSAPPDEPTPVAIAPAEMRAALADLPPGSPLRRLALLAPLAGAAWVDGDTLHARLITAE